MLTYTTNLENIHTHVCNMSVATHADLTQLMQPPDLPGLFFETY
jgi:hypothetical protein